jgi:1-acyl-sn-glycerol-3-phosphate acyltransferase
MIARAIAAVARAVAGGHVRWTTRLAADRQRIFFANHTSHLDFVVVWSHLPADLRAGARPVAARDYWDRGPIRRYLAVNVFRAVLIDRDGSDAAGPEERGRRAVARMVEGLGDTGSLILFPEGTRGSGERIGEFRSGLYHLCRARPGLELVPVHMENLNRILPKGKAIPVPMIGRVTFGAPMRLEAGEPKAEFLRRARAAVEELGR